MSCIGITGHSNLSTATVPLVAEAIRSALAERPDLVGVTCLARGADQVFANLAATFCHGCTPAQRVQVAPSRAGE